MHPLVLIGAGLFGLASTALAAPSPITLTTHDLPPYSYQNAEGLHGGLAVEVVQCVLQRLDIPYTIQVWPWARAQKLVEQGHADGFFAASRSPERDAYAVQTAIIAEQQWRWYLLADNQADPTTEDFRQQARVSSFIGANMLDWLTDNGYRVTSQPRETKGLLKMLQAKRIDAILANNLVMDTLLQQQGAKAEVRSVLLQDKPLGVYFSKKFLAERPGFLARFNGQVASCRGPSRA